jgi:hypothetical protein
MKAHTFARPLLLVALLFTAGAAARAEETAKEPALNRRELAIVVVETLQGRTGGAITDFDRLDMAFQDVAKQRKWPVILKAERLAANLPDHETELRIFTQPVREETSGDLTYRGWMTLTVNGTKHDFGVVTYRYYPRLGEHTEDALEKVFLGAAKAAAAKVEPILFPELSRKKS